MHAVGRAVHALRALGVGLLAVAGTSRHERAIAASNRRWTRRSAQPDQDAPPPSSPAPAPPDAVAVEPSGESPEAGLIETEAKKGKSGPTGPAGATGPTGANGPISTTFVAGGALLPATRFETVFAEAVCPEGSQVIVGGFDTSVDGDLSNEVKVDAALAFSEIDDVRATYRVVFTRAATDNEFPILVFAFAVCSP
jgi:hypothetical protein